MPQETSTVGAKVPRDRKDRLSKLAERRSSEEEQVTVSDLVREGIDLVLETVPESEISESMQKSETSAPSGDSKADANSQELEKSGGKA